MIVHLDLDGIMNLSIQMFCYDLFTFFSIYLCFGNIVVKKLRTRYPDFNPRSRNSNSRDSSRRINYILPNK